MNYKEQIKSIINKKSIWGEDFHAISMHNIVEVKLDLSKIDSVHLNRILLIIEDNKESSSERASMMLRIIRTLIAITSLFVSIFLIRTDVTDNKSLPIMMGLVGLVLLAIYIFFETIYIRPKNEKFNNKIKCIEIAIKEILYVKGISLLQYNDELKNLKQNKKICSQLSVKNEPEDSNNE